MSKYLAVIDADGFFLYDALLGFVRENGTRLVRAIDVQGLYRPRFDSVSGWHEGKPAAELDLIRAQSAAAEHRRWRAAEFDIADKKVNDCDDRGNPLLGDEWRAYRIRLRDMPEQSADAREWKRPERPA